MPLDLENPALRVTVESWTLCLVAFPLPLIADIGGIDDKGSNSKGEESLLLEKIDSVEKKTRKDTNEEAFFSLTRTAHEISILANEHAAESICEEARALRVKLFDDPPTRWRALRIVGPLDLSMVGVLHEFTRPLTDAGISIFVSSTYLTDYILVKVDHLDQSVAALKSAGWQF